MSSDMHSKCSVCKTQDSTVCRIIKKIIGRSCMSNKLLTLLQESEHLKKCHVFANYLLHLAIWVNICELTKLLVNTYHASINSYFNHCIGGFLTESIFHSLEVENRVPVLEVINYSKYDQAEWLFSQRDLEIRHLGLDKCDNIATVLLRQSSLQMIDIFLRSPHAEFFLTTQEPDSDRNKFYNLYLLFWLKKTDEVKRQLISFAIGYPILDELKYLKDWEINTEVMLQLALEKEEYIPQLCITNIWKLEDKAWTDDIYLCVTKGIQLCWWGSVFRDSIFNYLLRWCRWKELRFLFENQFEKIPVVFKMECYRIAWIWAIRLFIEEHSISLAMCLRGGGAGLFESDRIELIQFYLKHLIDEKDKKGACLSFLPHAKRLGHSREVAYLESFLDKKPPKRECWQTIPDDCYTSFDQDIVGMLKTLSRSNRNDGALEKTTYALICEVNLSVEVILEEHCPFLLEFKDMFREWLVDFTNAHSIFCLLNTTSRFLPLAIKKEREKNMQE